MHMSSEQRLIDSVTTMSQPQGGGGYSDIFIHM